MRSHRLYADPWLGGILHRDSFRLTFEHPAQNSHSHSDSNSVSIPQAVNGPGGHVFIHAKTDVSALAESAFLESQGFRLADTNLTFERPRGPSRPARSGIRAARAGDEEAVVALARGSFAFDRFHLDPRIGKQDADRLKGEWVRNFFMGTRGAAMAVAEAEGRIAGFLLFLTAPGALIIDLVAVAPDQQGKGLAAEMTRFGEALFPEAGLLRVGTQIGNGKALRSYQNQGFRLAGASYVFHYHGPMPAFAAAPSNAGATR